MIHYTFFQHHLNIKISRYNRDIIFVYFPKIKNRPIKGGLLTQIILIQ